MTLSETYEAIDLAKIEEYLAEKQEENLHLDFKTVVDSGLSNRDDRKNLAEAISGFANSDGGIIVWGVDARPNQQDIDCATAKKEIESLSRFLSKLNQYTGDAVTPIVDGVVHKKIESAGDRGFAVTLVPVSDSGPHMAKLGVDRYIKRSGSQFLRMEHFEVADMFGRRPRPKLVPRVRGDFPIIQHTDPEWGIVFTIVNEGRGTAKQICVELCYQTGMSLINFNDNWSAYFLTPDPKTGQRKVTFELAPPTRVIHPGMEIQFDGLKVLRSEHFTSGQYVQLLCTLYCDGCAPVQTVIEGTLEPTQH